MAKKTAKDRSEKSSGPVGATDHAKDATSVPVATSIDWRTTLKAASGKPWRCSHDTLQLFRESPAKFRNVVVAKTFVPSLSEKDIFDRDFASCAVTSGNATDLASSEGFASISMADRETIGRMIESLCGHEAAAELLGAEDRVVGRRIDWSCPHTDMPMTIELDVVVPSAGVAIGISTLSLPPGREPVGLDVFVHGRHRQAALALEALTVTLPLPEGDRWRYLNLVVCRNAEHDHGVFLGELQSAELLLGAENNRTARMELVTCLDFDQWAGRESSGIQTINFPSRLLVDQQP